MPFLGFRVKRVLQAGGLNTPESRARAADKALAIVAEHPIDLVRDQYVMEIASATQIDPELLRRRLRAGTNSGGTRGTAVSTERAMGAVRDKRLQRQQGPEAELVRLAIGDPEAVVTALLDAAANVETERELLDALADALFVDDMYLAAFRALARAATFHDAVDTADPTVADLLTRMAVEDTEATVNDVLALLVVEATRRKLHGSSRGTQQGSEDFVLANKESAEAKHAIEEIREGDNPVVGIQRLVPWLVRSGEGA
jgi:DNA primase